MSRTAARAFIGLLAISTAIGCVSEQHLNTAGGEVDLAPLPVVTLDSSELAVLKAMTDANVLGHLMVVDSIEIAAADTAMLYSPSDVVAAYAKMMHDAHTNDLAHEDVVAKMVGIEPTKDITGLATSPLATSISSLRLAANQSIDQRYLATQIQLHARALAELDAMLGVAQDAEVRNHLNELIPVVREHLARAQTIARDKGFDIKPAM